MRKSVIAIIIIVLVVLFMSVFVVKEGERGITLRFGKVLRDDENKPLVVAPGLHFKIPFIESVKMLDARIQTMDNQADRFVTKEKKDLIVDSYIKWRISDFSRYYLATGGGDVSQAEVLLKRKFSDRLRSEIGRLDVKDIVTDSRGRLTLEVRDALNSGSAGTEDEVATPAADSAIAEAAERVQAETNGKVPVINPNSMAALGIEVVDVRIKQINLPAEVSEAIYNRMRAEREAVARRQIQQTLDLLINARHQHRLFAFAVRPVGENAGQLAQDAVLAQIGVEQQLRYLSIHRLSSYRRARIASVISVQVSG